MTRISKGDTAGNGRCDRADKELISSIERRVHKYNAQTFIAYAKKCDVSLDEMAGLIPTAKLNRKLLQKLSDMSEDEQNRVLQMIIELIK